MCDYCVRFSTTPTPIHSTSRPFPSPYEENLISRFKFLLRYCRRFFGSQRTGASTLGKETTHASTAKIGMNIRIAFSAWNNVQHAPDESAPVLRRLHGTRYMSIGVRNANDKLPMRTLEDINRAIRSDQFPQYRGIAYDGEEGDSDSHYLERSFQLAKSLCFRVLVAFSPSAPYGIQDRNKHVTSFLASRNIDYLSPMMYASGNRPNYQLPNHMSTEILTVL